MVVMSVACAVGLSGCGNWIEAPTDAGQLGLTVDAAAQPVVAVMTCSKARPMIYMFEGRKKSDPEDMESVERGEWAARRGFAGVEKLAITAPGENWKTKKSPGSLEPGTLFALESGTAEDEHASLGGVDFEIADLAKLSPDQVAVHGKLMSWSAFAAYKCR